MSEDDYDDEEMYASHPLKLMIRHQQTELLSHPLCRALVRYKWTKVRTEEISSTSLSLIFSLVRACSTSTSCITVSLSASSLTSWWPQSDLTTL